MKKKLLLPAALGAAFLATTTFAGDYAKSPVVKGPIIDPGCACYEPGFEFSGFAAGLLPDGAGEDQFSGGASLGYFFTENLGIETSYSVFDVDPSEEHLITANLVYRFVNKDACFAPYIMAGGGVLTNGSTRGLYDVGAGVDIRFESLGCLGLFADATYNWVEDDGEDFTLIRAGFRIPF